jgi:glycosyltransferase involved in cell wall biosynthesis
MYYVARAIARRGIGVDLIGSSFGERLLEPKLSQRKLANGGSRGDWYPITPKSLPAFVKLSPWSVLRAKSLLGYDAVISELGAAWQVFPLGLIPGVNTILDEHNVEWQLMRQMEAFSGRPSQWRSLRTYERICHERSRHVITVSPLDKDAFVRDGDAAEKVSVIPNGVDTQLFCEDRALRSATRSEMGLGRDRPLVLFMGSMKFFPNLDAAKIILGSVFPKTKEVIPLLQMLIMGRGVETLKSTHRDLVIAQEVPHRRVPALVNAADMCIAPLRFGSGTRLKILEFMACGKAVIASSKAVEGLGVTHLENIVIEDDFGRYPGLIADLWRNTDLRLELGKQARNMMTSKCDWSACTSPLIPLLRD